ncbi:MAG TPA: lipoyl(octanoyl) transferase, partial [Glaciecola sp.]|nr:lipoyl(octanoyl) transferase [Glaciecola sp.]
AQFNIKAYPKKDAPGVYVNEQKICSIGLRIRKGCSFHGLALNVNMDLTPFNHINPCGYAGLEMTDSARLGGAADLARVGQDIVAHFCTLIGVQQVQFREGFDE